MKFTSSEHDLPIQPVILCGGSGTRLWPLSRESFPKQFVPLIDGKSLLELTLERVSALGSPLCVTNEEHRFFVHDMMNAILKESSDVNIFLEPQGRNTAPAILCAALMPNRLPSDLLVFLPSDHFIPDIDLFLSTVRSGVAAARAGNIVTFGIQPNYPSTAYGYIKKSEPLEFMHQTDSMAYRVERFVEKPNAQKAHEMLLSGDYFWNAGIFLCQVSTLIESFKEHALDIYQACTNAMAHPQVDGRFLRPDSELFKKCRSESMDYAVMEKFKNTVVIPFRGMWSDVGSWNAVAALSPCDDSGNRISGQGIVHNSLNTYINAPHRPVVALGTKDLVIVDTTDAVLVACVDQVEKVKEVVTQLKKKGAPQALLHRRVNRPWGWYDSVDVGDNFQVKRICVKPGASLSLQLHHHRAEHWIVVKGVARVTNGEQIFQLKENQSTYIPIGVKHRLENPGEYDLEMIEVQSGDYLGEDDIVRFEDTYGRR